MHYAAFLSAEGHANAELACALGDIVGEQTVEADAGEEESQERKEAGQVGQEALLGERPFDLLGLCAHIEKGQVVVGGGYGAAHEFDERAGVRGGA